MRRRKLEAEGAGATPHPTAGDETEADDSVETLVPITQLLRDWTDAGEDGRTPYYTPSPEVQGTGSTEQDRARSSGSRSRTPALPEMQADSPAPMLDHRLHRERGDTETDGTQSETEQVASTLSGIEREEDGILRTIYNIDGLSTDPSHSDGMNEYLDELEWDPAYQTSLGRYRAAQTEADTVMDEVERMRAERRGTSPVISTPPPQGPVNQLPDDLDVTPARDTSGPTTNRAAAAPDTTIIIRHDSGTEAPHRGSSLSSRESRRDRRREEDLASSLSYVSDWLDKSSVAMSELRRRRLSEERRRITETELQETLAQIQALDGTQRNEESQQLHQLRRRGSGSHPATVQQHVQSPTPATELSREQMRILRGEYARWEDPRHHQLTDEEYFRRLRSVRPKGSASRPEITAVLMQLAEIKAAAEQEEEKRRRQALRAQGPVAETLQHVAASARARDATSTAVAGHSAEERRRVTAPSAAPTHTVNTRGSASSNARNAVAAGPPRHPEVRQPALRGGRRLQPPRPVQPLSRRLPALASHATEEEEELWRPIRQPEQVAGVRRLPTEVNLPGGGGVREPGDTALRRLLLSILQETACHHAETDLDYRYRPPRASAARVVEIPTTSSSTSDGRSRRSRTHTSDSTVAPPEAPRARRIDEPVYTTTRRFIGVPRSRGNKAPSSSTSGRATERSGSTTVTSQRPDPRNEGRSQQRQSSSEPRSEVRNRDSRPGGRGGGGPSGDPHRDSDGDESADLAGRPPRRYGGPIAQLRVELLQRTPRPIGDRRRRGKEAECATCTPPPTILLSA